MENRLHELGRNQQHPEPQKENGGEKSDHSFGIICVTEVLETEKKQTNNS